MEEREIKEAITFCHELKSRIELAKQRGRDMLYQLMEAGKRPKREWCVLFELPQEDWPEYSRETGDEKISPELSRFYTTKEAASKLGFKDISSLSRLCTSGKIPSAIKIGHSWFIPKTWVHEQEKTSPNPKGNRGLARKR